jgi:hypothetical protein
MEMVEAVFIVDVLVILVRVGQGPMRSGIFVGVAAGVFNLSISRTGPLPFQRQIKLKTLRSLLKITSDTPEPESEGSTPHRRGRRGGTPDSDWNSKLNREHVTVLCLGAKSL